jgi:hypothetical protein
MKRKCLLTLLAAFCLTGTAMADLTVAQQPEVSWAMETGGFEPIGPEPKAAIVEEAEMPEQLLILTGGGHRGKGPPRYTQARRGGGHKCGVFGRANNCVARRSQRFGTCECVPGAPPPRGRGRGRRQPDF